MAALLSRDHGPDHHAGGGQRDRSLALLRRLQREARAPRRRAPADVPLAMTDNPFRTTGLRHGTDDPRGLIERIDAQLAERIEEAVEMAALGLLVDLRKRHNRPAPETDSRSDREEFRLLAEDLLAHLGRAFEGGLGPEQSAGLQNARAQGADSR